MCDLYLNILTDLLFLFFISIPEIFQSDDEQDAGRSLKAISNKTVWVIIMTGGGHFAGAVFRG